MRTSFAEKRADIEPFSYLFEVPKISRKPRRHAYASTEAEHEENSQFDKHCRDGRVAEYPCDLLQLLWTLVIEFGGEARCIDLNERMRRRFKIACSEKQSLEALRREIRYLEASSKLTLEDLGPEVLVARTTPSGVALALRGAPPTKGL